MKRLLLEHDTALAYAFICTVTLRIGTYRYRCPYIWGRAGLTPMGRSCDNALPCEKVSAFPSGR